MATPAERKALLFLSGVIVLGAGVRVTRSAARSAPDAASLRALDAQIAAVDSVRAAADTDRARRKASRPRRAPRRGTTGGTAGGDTRTSRAQGSARASGRSSQPDPPPPPPSSGVRVVPDLAESSPLERAMRAPLGDTAPGARGGASRTRRRPASSSGAPARSRQPGGAGAGGASDPAGRSSRGGAEGAVGPPVDVDRASAAELQRLPRIGPVLANRIVQERESGGPFGSLAELQRRVRGVGPSMARNLQGRVIFSGGGT